MNVPLVSWVCVTYNRPELLNELLYCFLSQDYPNKELVIINDQADILYVFDDPRVNIFNISKRYPSLGMKRNFSRQVTNGEYIFITDDDDIYYSNHISRLLNFHLNNQVYDVVTNGVGEYSESNNGIHNWNIYVPFNGACIKKEFWLNNVFPNDKSCSEDQDFTSNANWGRIDDKNTTFHYRWGLDVHHISGMGGDGIESYGIVTNQTPIGEPRIIKLIPHISDKVKSYYR